MDLAQTLRLEPGKRLLLLHVPDELRLRLQRMPDGVDIANVTRGVFDVALLCARSVAVLKKDLPHVKEAMDPSGVLWVAWPEERLAPGELRTADVHAAAAGTGLREDGEERLDETWVALRLVAP